MDILSISDLRYANANGDRIVGLVHFDGVDGPVPYAFAEVEHPELWAELVAGERGPIAAYVEPEPEPLVVPAEAFFSRTTEAEAEAIDTAMMAKTVKFRRLWQAAESFDERDSLWPVLSAELVTLFGQARRNELLARPG